MNTLSGNKCFWEDKWLDLNWLSEYRGQLMGFSIFIIVIYHFCTSGGTTITDIGLRTLFSQGYVGVDIFMVLSGLGLTYSCLIKFNLKEYYIKRWVRIFPFFTFITLIECWLVRGESLELALLRSTTLGYWFGFPYIDWYVPALVGLYVIYPFYFKWIVRPCRYYWIICIGIFSFITAIFVSNNEWLDWKHLAFIYRIPDFLLGSMVAVGIKNGYDKRLVVRYLMFSTILGVLCFAFKIGEQYYLWFTNLCMTPSYLYVLCLIFNRLSKSIIGKNILWPFGFMGMFTLELYRISSSFERLLTNETCSDCHYLFVFLWFIVSVFLAYIAYLMFKRINDFLIRKLISVKL